MALPTTGATVTTAQTASGGSTSALTGSHTTDASTNLLMVIVTYGYDASTRHATAASFDGTPLTELGTVVQGSDARADIWYLKNPGVKTATVSVGPWGGATARVGWTAINVIGAEVSGTTFGTLDSLAASTNNLSVTLSSATDELIIGGAASKHNYDTLSVQTGVSALSNFQHAANGSWATGKKTGASSVSFGYDNDFTTNGVAIAVPVKGTAAAVGLSIYGWRLRDDDGVEGSGGATFMQAEDTAIDISETGTSVDVALDTNFRVRLGLDEDNSADPAASTVQVRAKINGGAAFDVTSASTMVSMALSTHFVDDAATTDHGLAAPAGAFVAGKILETEGLSDSIDLTQNGYTIVEACVQALSAGLSGNDTIEFGLRYGGIDYFPSATMATVRTAAPATVAAGTATATTLALSWTDPNTTDVPIRPYYKKAADSAWIPEGTLPAGTTAHTFGLLVALDAGVSYDVGVAAWDDPYESIIVYDTASTGGADRQAHITAFELETEPAARQAHVTAYELEAEPAARSAYVTAFELEALDAPAPVRQAIITAFELETEDAAASNRAAHITAFELEAENAPRKALVTAFEMEVATAPRRATVTAFELGVGNAPRKALITAFEIQTYDAAQGDPEATLGRIGLGLSSIGIGV